MDGVLAIGGCDKNMPGAMIAFARLDIPAIFVYGGTIKPGCHEGRDLNIVSVFEALGQFEAGKLPHAELDAIERKAIPGAGACGGMYTANTMSSAIEALGMSLKGSSTMAAEDAEKAESTAESARVLAEAIRSGLTARRILTREAFENAIAVVMAIGGSTNAVLHLLAIAHAAGVPLALDDFETIRARVPVLCDLKPSGRYVTTDFHRAGGVPQVMRMLLDHGLLHGDCAHDHREDGGGDPRRRARGAARRAGRHPALVEAALRPGPPRHPARQPGHGGRGRQDHRREAPRDDRPRARVRQRGGLHQGDLRPADPPGRRGGHPLRGAEGRARDARDALADLGDHRRRPRRLGRPRSPTAASPGGTYGLVVGHVAPEAAVGGTIALVHEGDRVTIDAEKRLLQLEVDEAEIARRRAAWTPPAPRYTRGVLAKYARLVGSASRGAVTDAPTD